MSTQETSSTVAFESEIALIIKDEATHIRKKLAGLRQILEYDLRPKPRQIIYDTYYDTPENSLRQRKITLRVRRLSDTSLISTKSDIRRIAGNIIRRREMELPWAYNSVRLVAKNLKLNSPTMSVSQFRSMPVSRVLATMGLDVVQERRTRRDISDVVRKGKTPTSILAELSIDMVTYTFKDIKVGLSEVEVEARSARGLASVQKIANALVSKYQTFLQHWFYGKFVTGLAIRKLLETKAFQSHIVNGDLGSEAFKLIDRRLRSGRF